MKDFKGKVAVITGAANGIGFGIAERCAQLGMKVVLAGVNEENLRTAEAQLKSTGAELLCVQTDVSKRNDVEALAQQTLDAFGAVHQRSGAACFGHYLGASAIGLQWT